MKLYISSNCSGCHLVQSSPFFNTVRSRVTIQNISLSPQALEELRQIGSQVVPTLEDQGKVFQGAREILNYLQHAQT